MGKGKFLTVVTIKEATPALAGRDTLSHVEGDAAGAESLILAALEDGKAEGIVTIDLRGRSVLGDFMVIASGRSQRHVLALADQLLQKLRMAGMRSVRVEGLEGGGWVLLDTGDVIVHLFRPEIREFYNLEKMWQAVP